MLYLHYSYPQYHFDLATSRPRDTVTSQPRDTATLSKIITIIDYKLPVHACISYESDETHSTLVASVANPILNLTRNLKTAAHILHFVCTPSRRE